MEEQKPNGQEPQWKEVNPNIWKHEKEGDSVEGVYLSKDSDKGDYGSNLYHLQKEDGSFVGVWGNAVLDQRMKIVQTGQRVRITYKGTEKTKDGKRDVKIFKVEVAA